MQTIAIIDYGSGNLRSAAKAFERASRESGASAEIRVTDDLATIAAADRIVLPGVGAFADCRAGVDRVDGLRDTLEQRVIRDAVPFLGICVGMQLMARAGFEHLTTEGFAWIDGEVHRIEPSDEEDGRPRKVPHMGWNVLTVSAGHHPVLTGLEDGHHAYFVHSYAMRASAAEQKLATVDYGGEICAVVGRDNLVGTQFHPEKSQATGLRLIANFIGWTP
ncbi:MAG: imidazole glycerol phosphate synthase subunit HisH [Alphaproteobacteria bacterium]|nr:imidazole glycerol phosphate synthase subunit HisH [Alphaproteobacteria bacterium]